MASEWNLALSYLRNGIYSQLWPCANSVTIFITRKEWPQPLPAARAGGLLSRSGSQPDPQTKEPKRTRWCWGKEGGGMSSALPPAPRVVTKGCQTWTAYGARSWALLLPSVSISPSPGCPWVQQGTTQSFALRKGWAELAQSVAVSSHAVVTEGGRPRRLQPSFRPHAWNQQPHLWGTGLQWETLCSLYRLLRGPEGRGISAWKKSSLRIRISSCAGRGYLATRTATARSFAPFSPACPSLPGMYVARNSDWPPWAYRKYVAKKRKQIMWTELNFPQGVIFLPLLLLNANTSRQKDTEAV